MEPQRNPTKKELEDAIKRGEWRQVDARWGKVDLSYAHLEGADFTAAYLWGANLSYAHLEGACFIDTHLEGANLSYAHLERADLKGAHLEGADLRAARLEGAELESVKLSDERDEQHIGPYLADVQWGTVNLAIVDWSQVTKLGDEWEVEQERKTVYGEVIPRDLRLQDYKAAVRANRQLAVALQTQGLSEEAARFAYRAQRLQRVVLGLQRKIGQYLFSGFLDLIAGYGYKPSKSVIAYLGIIIGFALAYFTFGHLPLFPDSLVFSLMSFHGRGFCPSLSGETNLHNPLVMLAALEAVVGLFIEISFIATFTQRFFGK